MKKMMTFLTMITLVSSLVLTTSCKKDKSEDPVPAVPNTGGGNTGGGNTGTTNQAPIINTATYNNGFVTVNVSDNDGTVSQVEVSGSINKTEVAPFKFDVRNYLSAGSAGTYDILVVATDNLGGTDTKSLSFTITPKDITEYIMSDFLDKTMNTSNPSGLRFDSDGTVSTGVYSTNFWGVNGCTSGTWVINNDGTMTISNSCNNGTNYYTVTKVSSSGALKLTNKNNISYGGI